LFSDFSKYDVTQGVECIQQEHRHYRELGFHEVLGGEDYLEAAARSRVYSRDMFWQVPGTRKSGDNNTSSGNTRNTGNALLSWFVPLCRTHSLTWGDHIALAALGDDNFALVSVVFVEKVFHGNLEVMNRNLTEHCARLGYRLKVGSTFNITSAEYLSLRFYPVGDKYVVGNKPGRCLSKIGAIMHTQGRTEEEYRSYLRGTLISYLPTAHHVPFLRKYVDVVLDKLVGYEARYDFQAKYRKGGRIYEADESTWAAFMDTYGYDLDPAAETRFEQRLRAKPLNYIHDMECVDHMFHVDFLL
jgi:hypothetical protein